MGILGGYGVSVYLYGVNGADFWQYAKHTVDMFDLFTGPLKSLFFGMMIGLISCYKGFHCEPGAAGVGRACTESFVMICLAILGINLFMSMLVNTLYTVLYGLKPLL